MKFKIILSVIFFSALHLSNGISQCTRTSELQRTPAYNLEGTATLEQLESGDVQFRLSNDYTTTRGPDVQIYLNTTMTGIEGGMLVVDIGPNGLNHFDGPLTVDLPADTDINEFDYVVFHCVAFNVFWGGGLLSKSSCDDGSGDGGNNGGNDGNEPPAMCQETLVATTDWVEEVTVCPNDGEANVIPLRNTVMIPAGDTYAYIITDENNIIQEVVLEESYDFEGSSLETQLIFGVSYAGTLTAVVGQPLDSITASDCATISGATTFLTVLKEDCGDTFMCFPVTTATTAWVADVTVCPSDGQPNVIPLVNNEFIPAGDNFAYLLTDDQNILLQVIQAESFDFEGSGPGTNRIFAISYSGDLNLNIGAPISSITSTGCIELSDTEVFLTIQKGNCPVTTFAISGQVTSPSGDPIAGVELMDSQNEILATTNNAGQYRIESINQGTTVSIRPNVETSTNTLTNGVSAVDVVIITRHILDLAPFTNSYTLLAADVNNDAAISSVDIVQMIRAIVGLGTDFNNNTTWRFIDANQQISDGQMLVSPIEEIPVTISNADINGINFIGIKVGDVNDDASLDLN